MAIEVLKPNSIVLNDGFTGFVSNIDEDIATPDGSVMSTTSSLLARIACGMRNTVIRDIDTVNSIAIKVRAYANDSISGNNSLFVDFRINGTTQGPILNTVLSSSFFNYTFTNVNWNQDWTKAQLNSMEIRLSAVQEFVNARVVAIDTLNVEIDYTPLVSIEKTPGEATLLINEKLPERDRTDDVKWRYPPVASPGLSLYTPGDATAPETVINHIARPDRISRQLVGKPNYVNPITTTVQPNTGGIGAGWQGFIANIDESVADADGDTMYYTKESGDATPGTDLSLSFADVSAELNDQSDVLNTYVVVRFYAQPVSPWSGSFTASLNVELVIDGVSRGTYTIQTIDQTNPVNHRVNLTDWNQDWTRAQINDAVVKLSVAIVTIDPPNNYVATYVDAVDLEVQFSGQSPLEIDVPVDDTHTLNPQSVAVYYDRFITLPEVDRSLNGKAVTLFRNDTVYLDPDNLRLVGKLPDLLENSIRKPGIEALTLNEKTPTRIVDFNPLPSTETLDLTGKVPVSDLVDNHVRRPPKAQLRIFPEVAIADTTANRARNPARVQLNLNEKTPDRDRSENQWVDVGAGALTLAEKLPVTQDSTRPRPAAETLALTGKVPVAANNYVMRPAAETLSFTGLIPVLGPMQGELTLAGKAPVVITGLEIGGPAALTFTGAAPNAEINDVRVFAGPPAVGIFIGKAPSLAFTSQIAPGSDSRLISLTVDYRIEHIGLTKDTV